MCVVRGRGWYHSKERWQGLIFLKIFQARTLWRIQDFRKGVCGTGGLGDGSLSASDSVVFPRHFVRSINLLTYLLTYKIAQERRAIARKWRDAAVNFDGYQILPCRPWNFYIR